MNNKVKEFNKLIPHKKVMPLSARLLDVESELGELMKEYLKATKYETQDFMMTNDFELEFGDVLYSLLSLGIEANLDADKALDKVIEKYKARITSRGSMGSGR